MISDDFFMKRAMELAALGKTKAEPNPYVGCVIVHNEKIIGEGYHQNYGQAHAEVNAIHAVHDVSLLKEATLYVNLEPCSHHGKTPPCVDLIVKHQLKRVVISNRDPHRLVDGKGIEKLKVNGIAVTLNVLQEEGLELNKRFFTFHQKQRPYLILKWAQTQNGLIDKLRDTKEIVQHHISNSAAKLLNQQWRKQEMGILVGKTTVLHDDPLLTIRDFDGRQPVRIILDRQLEIPTSYKIFNADAPTLIFNCLHSKKKNNIEWIKISNDNFIPSVMQQLFEKQILSIIVEGGKTIHQQFIDLNLWDEARIIQSPIHWEEGLKAASLSGKIVAEEKCDDDTILYYYPNR